MMHVIENCTHKQTHCKIILTTKMNNLITMTSYISLFECMKNLDFGVACRHIKMIQYTRKYKIRSSTLGFLDNMTIVISNEVVKGPAKNIYFP